MELNEWRKVNGGGSINEYYAYLKREGISSPANTNREETNDTSNRNRGNVVNEKYGRKFGVGWYFLIGSIIVASLLNPDMDRHRDEVLKEVIESGKEELGDWGMLDGLKNWGVGELLPKTVKVSNRRNFLVFSVCDVYLVGEQVGYSVGFYGMIRIIDK